MLSYKNRIDRVYQTAHVMKITDSSRLVIMSDCHRGSGNWADDFAKNQNVCYAALKAYNREKYTYIELGDGDELWKNKNFSDITAIHSDVFELLTRFYRDNRILLIYGNHDIEKKFKTNLMRSYFDMTKTKKLPLFPDAAVYEGILIKYDETEHEMLLLHGHQTDFFNDRLWRLARFLVRHVWKPFELIGFNNPTSAAKNNKVKEKIEKRLKNWAEEKSLAVIAGHTHRPVFPDPAEGKYFNDGSCVHPWSITALEIVSGNISLVKWGQKTKEDGTVYIGKDVIGGPNRLRDYFI